MLPTLQRDTDLIGLAREIAIDHYDIEDILDRHHLSYDHWLRLCEHPRFSALLANEETSWSSAKNTHERVRLKSAAVIEDYLEDAQKALSDPNQTLVAKTGLAKLVASFAGIGGEEARVRGGATGGFSITINLGDRSVNVGVGVGVGEGNGGGEDIDGDVVAVGDGAGAGAGAAGLPKLEAVNIGEDVYSINADLM